VLSRPGGELQIVEERRMKVLMERRGIADDE
jgi:hypothetical protein